MAFWALGKVKNITDKLNLKQYKDASTKILKSYIQKRNDQPQDYFDFIQKPSVSQHVYKSMQSSKCMEQQSNSIKSLNHEQLLSIQLEQYKKLCILQQVLLSQHKQKQQQQLNKQYQQLNKQLQDLTNDQEKETQRLENERLREKVRNGETTIENVLRENIIMRQQVQKQKVNSQYNQTYNHKINKMDQPDD